MLELPLARTESTELSSQVGKAEIMKRINEKLQVTTIIVANGQHVDKGNRFNVGILLEVDTSIKNE